MNHFNFFEFWSTNFEWVLIERSKIIRPGGNSVWIILYFDIFSLHFRFKLLINLIDILFPGLYFNLQIRNGVLNSAFFVNKLLSLLYFFSVIFQFKCQLFYHSFWLFEFFRFNLNFLQLNKIFWPFFQLLFESLFLILKSYFKFLQVCLLILYYIPDSFHFFCNFFCFEKLVKYIF